jgi:hypothetical protein
MMTVLAEVAAVAGGWTDDVEYVVFDCLRFLVRGNIDPDPKTIARH